MRNTNVTFNIRTRKRLKLASWLEKNVSFIFESNKFQEMFNNYFKGSIDRCVKIKLS